MREFAALPSPDRLSRVVKLAIDSGEAATVQEAFALFKKYSVRVRIGREVARSMPLQAVLLTVANIGRRCFLGGVYVDAPHDVLSAPTLVHIPTAPRLGDAVAALGGRVFRAGDAPSPEIWIGDLSPSSNPEHPIAVRATFDGWRGATVPVKSVHRLSESGSFTPACVLAGALATSEVFQHLRHDAIDAGDREVGLSLWRPEVHADWRVADGAPELDRLPSRLWLLGLGHLGQAYLWNLGLLPFADPTKVSLVLQDVDILEEANDSTGMLTTKSVFGQRKTRAMAAWAEARGFKTSIVERQFAANFAVGRDEPRLLLCGVDNAVARAQLEEPGFSRVIDAGLGKGNREYLALQLHSFPSQSRRAKELWQPRSHDQEADSDLISRPAYKALGDDGVDDCGLTTLAGRSVGAPFVGAATAALVTAETIRTVVGAHTYAVIDATLRGIDRRIAIPNDKPQEPTNLGLTPRAA